MPSDETRIVIDAVSEAVEQPDEVIESKDPRLELYNGGKLVKRWRLPGKDNRIRVELVRNSPEQGVIEAGVYLDPESGRFYGRIPETEDGALYVADDLTAAKKLLRGAAHDLAEIARAANGYQVDDREWIRVIRIAYPNPDNKSPDWRTASPSGHGGYGTRYTRAGHTLHDEHDTPARPESKGREADFVGPLYVTRAELAQRPDARIDVREWEEDYQARLEAWKGRYSPSENREKPERLEALEHGRLVSGRQFSSHDRGREFPWDPDLWRSLKSFQDRIRQMDGVIRNFILKTEAGALVESLLSGDGARLLTKLEG